MKRALEGLPGIRSLELDARKGSLLIRFDRRELGRPDARQALTEVANRFLSPATIDRLKRWL